MINELIACCGLDCARCDARIATLGNDRELKEKTARLWSAMNNAPEITAETINCTGCRTEGAKFAYCSTYCAIRECVIRHGFCTCADCAELDHCPMLALVSEHNPGTKENLRTAAARPL